MAKPTPTDDTLAAGDAPTAGPDLRTKVASAIADCKRLTDPTKPAEGLGVKLHVPTNLGLRRVVAQVVEVVDKDAGTLRLRYMSEAGVVERAACRRRAVDAPPRGNDWEAFPGKATASVSALQTLKGSKGSKPAPASSSSAK